MRERPRSRKLVFSEGEDSGQPGQVAGDDPPAAGPSQQPRLGLGRQLQPGRLAASLGFS